MNKKKCLYLCFNILRIFVSINRNEKAYGDILSILNLVHRCNKNKFKLDIDYFINDEKMRNWYCNNFNCDLRLITCNYSASTNRLNCLKWCRKNNKHWNKVTFNLAIINNNIDILKYLKKHRCPYDFFVCSYAVLHNKLHILKWLIENGYKIREKIMIHAASCNNLEIIKFLLNIGQEINRMVNIIAARNNYIDILDYTYYYLKLNNKYQDNYFNMIPCIAAKNKHLDTLKWCYNKKIKIKEDAMFWACKNKDYQMINWFKEYNPSYNSYNINDML